MAYTVKTLAGLSGVSVRTLHFYDEMGLLKPAYVGGNGYRFYEEPQLLRLQQILFYRELGFELKQIQGILDRSDFDQLAALVSHRKVLRKNLATTQNLIVTIDKTIAHLKGTKKMKAQELFKGFDPKLQAQHEKYLVDRFGEGARKNIVQSKQRIKNWTKADWEKSTAAFVGICRDLVALMERQEPCESDEVQTVIGRHYAWLKQFWKPTRVSYVGHSEMIVDSDLRKAYEPHHPDLPEFLALAIKEYAATKLS